MFDDNLEYSTEFNFMDRLYKIEVGTQEYIYIVTVYCWDLDFFFISSHVL